MLLSAQHHEPILVHAYALFTSIISNTDTMMYYGNPLTFFYSDVFSNGSGQGGSVSPRMGSSPLATKKNFDTTSNKGSSLPTTITKRDRSVSDPNIDPIQVLIPGKLAIKQTSLASISST